MTSKFLKEFHNNFLVNIRPIINEYGFFDYTISPSSDITERDFCMVISDYFTRQNYVYEMEYTLNDKDVKNGKRPDFMIQHDNANHYIEIKDCGIYEIKYAKSLAWCKEIEEGTYTGDPLSLTFHEPRRMRSKTDWLNFFTEDKGSTSEGLAKDVYKFYRMFIEGSLKCGDICSCIAFVFWPQPFPVKFKKFAQIRMGAKTIEVGTRYLIKQLQQQTHMQNIAYSIDTIELPSVSILNPFTAQIHEFNSSDIKLTIEILSWVNK